jgi:hypothetical protein
MNLQESIRRILREDDYSPAGKEIIPNSIIVHKSNPMFRDKIMEQGLKVRAGECYKIYVGYGVKCKPAIFATNSTNKRAWFDSSYDDDIWFIDTRMIPDVKWYKDRHFESTKKHIVTFQDIPKEAITLKYEGTGSGDVKKWNKDSPNLYESIRKIIRNMNEEIEKPQYQIRRERIQKLVDDIVNDMKLTCEIMNSEDDEIISFSACELIDADVKVSVSDVGIVNDRKRVLVVIKYKNWRYLSEDEFVYELSKELRKWIGDNYVEVEDYINTFPPEERQW